MAVRKRESGMGPRERSVGGKTLMDLQDTVNRGDGRGKDAVVMSFRIPAALRADMEAYASSHNLSMTTLVIQGLNWRLDQRY